MGSAVLRRTGTQPRRREVLGFGGVAAPPASSRWGRPEQHADRLRQAGFGRWSARLSAAAAADRHRPTADLDLGIDTKRTLPIGLSMGGVVVRRVLFAGLAASMIPAAAFGQRADSGLLTVCNVSGARPATGTFTFTYSTVASAGGTQTFNIAVGTCASRVFDPQGVSVTVTENVPTGYAVTGIALTPTPGGPGPRASSRRIPRKPVRPTATLGSGQATLTFTTNGPTGSKSPCKVPNVFGFTLTAAEAAVRRAHCTVGIVRKVYSNPLLPRSRVQPKPASWLGSRSQRPRQSHGQPRTSPVTLRNRPTASR